MASVSVLSAVYGLLRSREPIASVRSPVLLPPPATAFADARTPDSVGSTTPPLVFPLSRSRHEQAPLTEHTLRASHLAWLIRFRDLGARFVALNAAKEQGLDSCWAGKTTRAHIRSVQRAADEAKWVEERLRAAVVWCRRRGLRKLPVRVLVGVGARKQGQPLVRPVHSDFPPTLLDLPYPLPIAQEANIYALSVHRPPALNSRRYHHRPQERDEEREAQSRDAPPLYREEADEAAGERTLDRAEIEGEGGELEYARALEGLMREAEQGLPGL
ncbi:hypothetical protein JCM10207_005583 [Rhodosporidiobolus poonsookiae]